MTLISSFSGIVPMSEDFYLFCFFWVGFMVFRSAAFRNRFCARRNGASGGSLQALHTFKCLQDDFTHRRYEKVLEGWSQLDQHTAEALSLVVTVLLALGRPDDIGTFITKTCESLPSLRPGLHQVVSAVASPACDVRRQHIFCALRDIDEHAREVLDQTAVQEMLFAYAKLNEEARVASLLVELAEDGAPVEPQILDKVVRNFLSSQNMAAALTYLHKIPGDPPPELITTIVKVSTEAEISDDSHASGVRSKAWEAFDALEEVKMTSEAVLLFLEWAARQTPVDVVMALHVEELLRNAGPLPSDACDALVRVNASSSGNQDKAFSCFDEFVELAEPTEASLVGMISSCIEAHNSDLAEHIFSWARAAERCTLPVFSATLKVLAATEQNERIVAIYESSSSNKELVLDEGLLEKVASCAEQAGHSELARKLSKITKKSKLNVQNHLSLMRTCAQEGDVEQVLELLQDLQEHGSVDTMTYNVALDACVSAGDANAAKTVLKEMQTSGHLDVASYNIMLKQCLSQGASPKAAQTVLKEMRQQGLEPNTATYNSLLSCALTTGDFAGVWQTVDDMESSGKSADIYTLSIIFKGYKRERRTMDADCIHKALSLIKNHSVKLDEVLVNVALEACLVLRDVRVIKRALDTFWDSGFTLPKQASLHTYGSLIKAYGQIQGLTEVWQLWTEVTEEKGMEPSEQLYGQMLDVLVSNNSLDDALNLFEEMKQTHESNLNSQGFAVAYAMIIRGFAQQKDCSKALQCYEEMKSHGCKASLVVLNTLIDACSRVGDMDAASMLYKDMADCQCVPDLITYSTLIKGYCNSNDLEQALQLFGLMQEKGIRPDAIVFNSLLDGCAKKQVPALCEQVISDMEAAGVVPSNHSASILIKLYGRCRDLDAAFRVINEMPKKYGFRANNAVYTCLMSACIANGSLDKALDLRVCMLEDNIYPDERTYSTLLRGALRACNVDQCVMLVNAALDQGGSRSRNLLEEDLVRSVLMLTQRYNSWESHGLELQTRLRSNGISVRLPLPSDSCNRSDGFGQSQRDSNFNGKRNFGGNRDQATGKDGRYQQHYNQQQHHSQYQQRRY